MIRAVALLFLFLATQLASAAPGKQLTGAYAPAASAALSPAQSQKAFTVPPGFEVRLFASEPDIINPVAMTWDERGRLWVVELFEYPLGAPKGAKPRDRIKILEDTDGDGRADKVTIFADGLNLATGIALGNGGVYVGQAPDLLFLRDTNHDDHADTRQTLLTGFDTNDRHELLNGFTWGPDGWLYMTHGVFNHSKVKIPGRDDRAASSSSLPHTFEASEPGVEVSAALCRYHPVTKKFEVFADGTSNPWGVDFDAAGNAFVSACVIDHLWHLAPGGIYQRQAGAPANPYAYELLPSIVDHKHYMAAYSGICIYQGDMFPSEYQGHVFFGNIHQCAINHDRLFPNGSSFKSVAEKDFLTTTDGWFRPVSEQVGPDGALWIADWYDKYPCYQNAQADPEGVDRTYGRIWRVVYTNAAPREASWSAAGSAAFPFDLSKLPNDQLIQYLSHPNVWQRRMAQKIYVEREKKRDTSAFVSAGESPNFDRLASLIATSKNLDQRLAAIAIMSSLRWSFSIEKLVSDENPIIRAAAARAGAQLICYDRSLLQAYRKERKTVDPEILSFFDRISEGLLTLASDSDPRVRLAVATAVHQLVSGALTVDTDIANDEPTRTFAGKTLVKLIESSSSEKDPLLPYMIWTASEPLLAAKPAGGLKWLAENGARTMPLSGILARKSMRRISDTGETNKLDQAVDFVQRIAGDKSGLLSAALDGLIEAQKAKSFIPDRETKELFATLRDNPDIDVQTRARDLGALWNDEDSFTAVLHIIDDYREPVDERVKAIELCKLIKDSSAEPYLLHAMRWPDEHEPVVVAALDALTTLPESSDIGLEILGAWRKFTPAERRAAVDALVSRKSWANNLLDAVEQKEVEPKDISASAFRALAHYKDAQLDDRTKQLLGRFRESSEDKQKLIHEKRHMVLHEEPDIAHGHEVAKKTCFVCHKLYGEGADVGPDLTGVGRSSLDALLNNVIDPNQVVGKGYENVEVETKDGRSLSGRMTENDATHVKLLSAGPKEEVVAKSDIESLRVSQLSVMPEGLEQMPEKDFRDLVWFILDPPGDNRPLTKELKKQLSTTK